MKSNLHRRALLTAFLAAWILPSTGRGQNAVNFEKSRLAIDTVAGPGEDALEREDMNCFPKRLG